MSSRFRWSPRFYVLVLVAAWGCASTAHGPRPEPSVGQPPRDGGAAPVAVATAAASHAPDLAPPDAGQEETSEDDSDLPDEPEDGQGRLRDVGGRLGGGVCRLRSASPDPSLPPVVRQWITEKEEVAAREASSLCGIGRAAGSVAAGFACRARWRRANVLIVACYTFPNVAGNSNPSRSHAVFDLTAGRAKRLGVAEMFLDRRRTCRIVGEALAARGPQLHERSPTQWASRCLASSSGPVSDEAVSVVGTRITFDLPYDFLAWGNAPDPLSVPIEEIVGVLTPRLATLLAAPRESPPRP